MPSTTTGKFPIDANSDAAKVDPNPNEIQANDFTLTVQKNPKPAEKPTPVGLGAIAIMTNGGLLYSTLDGKGKDANKYEVQDNNVGHPSESQHYHAHQIPPILYEKQNKVGPSPVLARALDGYPIVAAYKADGNLYSTAELDKFHGREVEVKQEDGSVKKQWAYCVSLDYPYTIGAFRGTPSKIEGLKEVALSQSTGGNRPNEMTDENSNGRPGGSLGGSPGGKPGDGNQMPMGGKPSGKPPGGQPPTLDGNIPPDAVPPSREHMALPIVDIPTGNFFPNVNQKRDVPNTGAPPPMAISETELSAHNLQQSGRIPQERPPFDVEFSGKDSIHFNKNLTIVDSENDKVVLSPGLGYNTRDAVPTANFAPMVGKGLSTDLSVTYAHKLNVQGNAVFVRAGGSYQPDAELKMQWFGQVGGEISIGSKAKFLGGVSIQGAESDATVGPIADTSIGPFIQGLYEIDKNMQIRVKAQEAGGSSKVTIETEIQF